MQVYFEIWSHRKFLKLSEDVLSYASHFSLPAPLSGAKSPLLLSRTPFFLDLIWQTFAGILPNALRSHTFLADAFQEQV